MAEGKPNKGKLASIADMIKAGTKAFNLPYWGGNIRCVMPGKFDDGRTYDASIKAIIDGEERKLPPALVRAIMKYGAEEPTFKEFVDTQLHE